MGEGGGVEVGVTLIKVGLPNTRGGGCTMKYITAYHLAINFNRCLAPLCAVVLHYAYE